MRVLIAAESFLPMVNGVTNSVLRVLEHLDRRGHEALVVAPAPGPRSVRLSTGTSVPVERIAAVNVPFYDGLTAAWPSERRSVSIVRRYRPDVVHLAAPTVLGRQIGRAASQAGVPTVALFQTDLAGFVQNYELGLGVAGIWRWLRTIHNRADLTLAPTPTLAAELESRGFRRVGVWGRGVDHRQFDPARRSTELREVAGASAERPLVGFVGRLAAEKQIERLHGLRSLGDRYRLMIVGDGPERDRLERLFPTAHFTGMLRGEALGEAMASLDVFVHTGPHETFCQTIQEAMAAGVPVVAPDAGGPRDLVLPGETGWRYHPDRPTEMVEAVASLLQSAELRTRMGADARRMVADRSWEAIGDVLLDHYARVLSLTGSRSIGPVRTPARAA
ncbi:MAG: glycosyltransferase family 1 protein [Actinomycetota bacterium]